MSDSYYESRSVSCGLNGTHAVVHPPINKAVDHNDDLINLPCSTFLPKYPSFVYECEGFCRMLDGTPLVAMISPGATKSASCMALLCSFPLLPIMFSLRFCWNAFIAYHYAHFFMGRPVNRASINLFSLLILWYIYDSITQLV